MPAWRFTDRTHAGRALAEQLRGHGWSHEAIVLALPRGGVPVAYEIASRLRLPMDVLVVRKIGVPFHPEYAMGALSADGTYAVQPQVLADFGITSDEFMMVFERELEEARRRRSAYRGLRPFPNLARKTVILVDDGLATGSTMRVAVDAVRRAGAGKVVVAIPVAPPESISVLAQAADEIVCPCTPSPFRAVSEHYEHFDQVSDVEVEELLAKAAQENAA